jgi:hypothetical protein
LLSLVTAAEFIHGDAAVTNALSALPTHVLQLLSWFSGGSVPLHRLLLIIGDPSPDNELDYMVSVPQMLQHFKHTIDEQIAARTLL